MGVVFLLHLPPIVSQSVFSGSKFWKQALCPPEVCQGLTSLSNLMAVKSWKSGLVAKNLLACIRKIIFSRLRQQFITSCEGGGSPSPYWSHIYCAESRSRFSNMRETWIFLELVDWGLRAIVKTGELEVFSLQRRRLSLPKYLMRGRKEVKATLLTGHRTRLKNLNRWNCISTQEHFYHKGGQRSKAEWGALRCCASSRPLKPNRAGPWTTCSILPSSDKRGLDFMICRRPFPPTMILWFCTSAVSSTLWCLTLQIDLPKDFFEGWQVCGGSKGEICNLQTQMLSNEGLDSRAKYKSKYGDLFQRVKSKL